MKKIFFACFCLFTPAAFFPAFAALDREVSEEDGLPAPISSTIPWEGIDVGWTTEAGSHEALDEDSFVLKGSGRDIWHGMDGFYFAHIPWEEKWSFPFG